MPRGPRLLKYADGGLVRASQADVRRADKVNVRDMPEREAERVKRSEAARELEAYQDAGGARRRDSEILSIAARVNPKMRMDEYVRNPIVKQAAKEAEEADDLASRTGADAARVQAGRKGYQYADGGLVKKRRRAGPARLSNAKGGY